MVEVLLFRAHRAQSHELPNTVILVHYMIADAQVPQTGDERTKASLAARPVGCHARKKLMLSEGHYSCCWQTKSPSKLTLDQLHAARSKRNAGRLAPLLQSRPMLLRTYHQQALTPLPGGLDLSGESRQLTVKQVRCASLEIDHMGPGGGRIVLEAELAAVQYAFDEPRRLLQKGRLDSQFLVLDSSLEIGLQSKAVALDLGAGILR